MLSWTRLCSMYPRLSAGGTAVSAFRQWEREGLVNQLAPPHSAFPVPRPVAVICAELSKIRPQSSGLSGLSPAKS